MNVRLLLSTAGSAASRAGASCPATASANHHNNDDYDENDAADSATYDNPQVLGSKTNSFLRNIGIFTVVAQIVVSLSSLAAVKLGTVLRNGT